MPRCLGVWVLTDLHLRWCWAKRMLQLQLKQQLQPQPLQPPLLIAGQACLRKQSLHMHGVWTSAQAVHLRVPVAVQLTSCCCPPLPLLSR